LHNIGNLKKILNFFAVLGAFDMDTMVQKVYQITRQAEESSESRMLLIEGILIFNHR
jgi:hypothetical protein